MAIPDHSVVDNGVESNFSVHWLSTYWHAMPKCRGASSTNKLASLVNTL